MALLDRPDTVASADQAMHARTTAALVPPHAGTPWVVVDGVVIGGGWKELLAAVCDAFGGALKPEACQEPPR